jgi:hypothetical protein
VYDMYYWDQPDQAARSGAKRPGRPVRGSRHLSRPGSGSRHPARPDGGGTRTGGVAGPAGPAAQALQVALDRRDNGGDSSARRDQ